MTTTPVPNGGFETAGANVWIALGWAYTIVNSLEEYAGFSTGVYDVAWEGFELGWNNDNYKSEFEPIDLEAVIFDDGIPNVLTHEFEDFEHSWLNNENWHDELVSTAIAIFDSGTPESFENYEEEWDSNEDWRRYFSEPGFLILTAAAGWWRVDLLGEEYAYQASGTDTPTDIASALATLINGASIPIAATPSAGQVLLTPTPKALDIGLVVEAPTNGVIVIVASSTDEDLSAAAFNTVSDLAEGFEREWRSNENFEFSLGATETTVFDTTEDPYEDFESEWPTEIMQTII